MEMNSIATDLKTLANLSHFNVFNSASERIITVRVQEDVGTILVEQRSLRVTSELYVSGQETNFSSHVDRFAVVVLSRSEMLELERVNESDYWLVRIRVVNGLDGVLFTFSWVIRC
jgi:hypothetical protein